MAFPISDPLGLTVSQILDLARNARRHSQVLVSQCDAGALNLVDTLNFLRTLGSWRTRLASLAAVSGVYDSLAREKPNAFADAAAAEAAMDTARGAVDTMIVFIETNIPMDDPATTRRAAVQVVSNDGTGTVTPRTVTNGGQLAAFKSQLETFRDAFEAN